VKITSNLLVILVPRYDARTNQLALVIRSKRLMLEVSILKLSEGISYNYDLFLKPY
jgi:hypothetical protein